MTGPEHYREAERLAASLKDRDLHTNTVAAIATLAGVHATLAHTAATAHGSVILTLPADSDLACDWNQAIGAPS